MIVKLKCIEKCGTSNVTVGAEYDALVDKNDIYVISNDDGYFTFIDFDDPWYGIWEVVSE